MLQSGNKVPPSAVASACEERATLAWKGEDGRENWTYSEKQLAEIRRRRRQGFDHTLTDDGEVLFFPRKPTNPCWWLRGPDDENVRAAAHARRLHNARKKMRRAAPGPSPLPRRTPTPKPTARRPAARRSLGARSSADPGDSDGDEPSQAGWRYSPATYRSILWSLSERIAAAGVAAEEFNATRARCELLLERLERAEAEGKTLTLVEALDASEGGEHVDAQWWGSTSQLVDLLWWANVPFKQTPEGVVTNCPACVRGPLFAVERRPDHAGLACGHGCSEPAIRKKLKEAEALAFDHQHEQEEVSQ